MAVLLAALALAGLLVVVWSQRADTPTAPPDLPSPDETGTQERLFASELALDADALPTGAIVGRVVGADGRPTAGASLTLGRSGPRTAGGGRRLLRVWTGRSGADGAFRFEGVPLGLYVLTAMTPGASSPAVTLHLEGADTSVEARLALRTGAHRVHGRVLSTGEAAPGEVTVTAEALVPAASEGLPASYQVAADASGAYALDLAPGVYVLVARARAHAPQRVPLAVARDVEHTFQLGPAARLLVAAAEQATHQPVAGAEVGLVGSPDALLVPGARTAASGTVEVEGAAPLRGQVLVRSKGGVGLSSVVAAPAGGTTQVQVELSPGRSLSGRVLAEAGRGVEGALVQLRSEDPLFPAVVAVRSGAGGAFRFEGLLEDRYRLEAVSAAGASGARAVLVGSGDVRGADIHLEPTVVVQGALVGADGVPAAGASVRLDVLEGSGTAPRARLTTADAQGRFAFARVPPGRVLLTATHPSQGVASELLTPSPAGGRAELGRLTLGAPAAVVGTVRLGDGTPAAGVTVVGASLERPTGYCLAVTGSDGRYRLGPFTGGQVAVRAAPRGRWETLEAAALPAVTVTAGQETPLADIVLPVPLAPVSGVVRAADGRPAAGAAVQVLAPEQAGMRLLPTAPAFTSEAGTFSLEVPRDGAFVLRAAHPDFPEQDVRSSGHAVAGLELRLSPGGHVRGAVTSEGRAVTEYTLSALRASAGPSGTASARAPLREAAVVRVRNAEGRFSVGPLGAGTYLLHVRTAAGQVGRASVTMDGQEHRGDVRVKLSPAVADRGPGAP